MSSKHPIHSILSCNTFFALAIGDAGREGELQDLLADITWKWPGGPDLILTVAMQYGKLFLQPGQRSSHSGSKNSQYGHGVVGSSTSDVSGRLSLEQKKWRRRRWLFLYLLKQWNCFSFLNWFRVEMKLQQVDLEIQLLLQRSGSLSNLLIQFVTSVALVKVRFKFSDSPMRPLKFKAQLTAQS